MLIAAQTETKTIPRQDTRTETELAPLYNLYLHDDNEHTYDYVIEMLTTVLQVTTQKAFELAITVDTQKIVLLLTGPLEIVEHRHEQISHFGPDWRLPQSKGSMRSTIEAAG